MLWQAALVAQTVPHGKWSELPKHFLLPHPLGASRGFSGRRQAAGGIAPLCCQRRQVAAAPAS